MEHVFREHNTQADSMATLASIGKNHIWIRTQSARRKEDTVMTALWDGRRCNTGSGCGAG